MPSGHLRTAEELRERVRQLRASRRQRQSERSAPSARRIRLEPAERNAVRSKTAGRCHICGGVVEGDEWQADHVLAYSAGGAHSADNYLVAHRLCNNYRWDYSAEEFQWVLKIGVWARLLMEKDDSLGAEMLGRFVNYERTRLRRRRDTGSTAQSGEEAFRP